MTWRWPSREQPACPSGGPAASAQNISARGIRENIVARGAARVPCCSVPRRIVMNRRKILTLATAAALGLALSPGNLDAQQGTLKEQLVGTWTIVSFEGIAPNGTKRQIANPKGFLIFDPSGRYAQVIARRDRPKFKSSGEPTVEE